MNDAGRIGFVPRGKYDNTATYDFLDFVYYNGNSYVAKKLTVGNEPQESNEYWQIFAKGGIEDVGIQFQEATERKNIQSGEDTPTLFGKIKKWFADLKTVAWSGDYIDLSNKPTIPAAVAVKGNAESTYRTGNVNLTPANIGVVATTKVLTTKEQINANTDTSNVAGATAVKEIASQINSNLATSWSSAIITSNVGVGEVQWHRWGLMCEVVIAAEITMLNAWTELKIATNLPPSRFGSGARGIIQSQETGLAYCVIITNNGELFVRTDTHPQSDWYRGAITYITTNPN